MPLVNDYFWNTYCGLPASPGAVNTAVRERSPSPQTALFCLMDGGIQIRNTSVKGAGLWCGG